MDASDLSSLACARAGTVGATLRTHKHEIELQALGESAAYLKLEKPRFLFLEGSGGAPTTLVAAIAALADVPAALACASAVRATSSTDRPAADASAPAAGTYSSVTSAALGDGGGGFHLSGGLPPSFSSSPPPPPTNSLELPGGKALLLTQPVLLALLLPALPPPDPLLLPARGPLLLPSLRGAGDALAQGAGGSDRAACTVTLC
jgi:hypothetical protein